MKYILGVIGVIILTILAVIMIVGRNPDGSDSSNPSNQPGTERIELKDFVTVNSWVNSTAYGKVVGQEERRAIRITVSATERKIEVLKGYEESVEKRAVFPNTLVAYEEFLHALDKAGYTRERETKLEEKGSCPQGNRFVFELHNGNETTKRLWATSCRTTQGTFAGNNGLVRQLFQAQIPETDYRTLTSGVSL